MNKTANSVPALPTSFKVLVWIFIVLGCISLVHDALTLGSELFEHPLFADHSMGSGLITLLLGIGLYRRSEFARTCVLGSSWLIFILFSTLYVAALLFAQGGLFPRSSWGTTLSIIRFRRS